MSLFKHKQIPNCGTNFFAESLEQRINHFVKRRRIAGPAEETGASSDSKIIREANHEKGQKSMDTSADLTAGPAAQ